MPKNIYAAARSHATGAEIERALNKIEACPKRGLQDIDLPRASLNLLQEQLEESGILSRFEQGKLYITHIKKRAQAA